MSGVLHHVRLSNAARPEVEALDVLATVDAGQRHLSIPLFFAQRLRLMKSDERIVTSVDGQREAVDYVGPVLIETFGRGCFTGALVTGDQVVLGSIPLNDMSVLADPASDQLIPQSDQPTYAGTLAMGIRTLQS